MKVEERVGGTKEQRRGAVRIERERREFVGFLVVGEASEVRRARR